jgi:hypothetical protein
MARRRDPDESSSATSSGPCARSSRRSAVAGDGPQRGDVSPNDTGAYDELCRLPASSAGCCDHAVEPRRRN